MIALAAMLVMAACSSYIQQQRAIVVSSRKAKVEDDRLRARGDDESYIRRRVELGEAEVARGAKIAAHTVVNEDVDQALAQLTAIVEGVRSADPCAANPEES